MHEEVLEEVLQRVKPTKKDLVKLSSVAQRLIRIAEKKAQQLGIRAEIMLAGSAARGTWLKGEKDIDLLLLFPEDIPKEQMEELGMRLAREIAGPKGREEYAEHPYVRMDFEGFEVDLVPCFKVSDPRKIKSATDRTPHHQRYVKEKLTAELVDEILILKQFARGIGVYGAESRVQGFSGYLCELLILHYGSFTNLVKGASSWSFGAVIDLENFYKEPGRLRELFVNHPLIVVDPVDPTRNVAAAVSPRSFGIFIQACRDFLRSPNLRFFFPRPPKHLTEAELLEVMRRRGTKLLLLEVEHGGMSEEIVYPQLRKTARAIHNALIQRGFTLLRSGVWADGKTAAVLIELFPKKLPRVEVKQGPRLPLDAARFIETHLNSKRKISGPAVNEFGNVVFEVERMWSDPVKVIKNLLPECMGFGKDIAALIKEGRYRLVVNAEIAGLAKNKNLGLFLSEYFDNRLPWYR